MDVIDKGKAYIQPFMVCDALDNITATPKISTTDSVHCYTFKQGTHKVQAN